MISVGNLSILSDFCTRFWPKCSTAVSMATAMQMDERIVDYLVLGPNTQDRKVSAKSVTMRATALCKNLSGYRELLLNTDQCSKNMDIRRQCGLFFTYIELNWYPTVTCVRYRMKEPIQYE